MLKYIAAAAMILVAFQSPAGADQVISSGRDFVFADCATLGFSPEDLGEGVECGWLSVPESRQHQSREVHLAVVIARSASRDQAKEPVLYLHGGPGIATLDVIPRALRGKSWPLLRERHDLIFFDQRGTGRSTPTICPAFDQSLSDLTARGVSGRAKSAAQLVAARQCRSELRALSIDPSSYSSSEIAADIEDLRGALGVERWNIFATSFGSLPAAEVIRRWPATVRALILDSAFPPNSPNRAEQLNATAASFAAYQRRCDRDVACRAQSPNLRKSAAAISRRLDRAPIITKTGRVTGEAFRDAVWTLMVNGSTAAYLPELLRRGEAGDDELIRRFVATFGDPGYFGGYAHAQAWLVNCHDIFPRPSRSMLVRAAANNPDLASGLDTSSQDAMCDTLQPAHAGASFYRTLENKVPTLVLFGEFDPATPRTDALRARQFFGNATLVEIDGASHAPFYTDACTKGLTVQFLANPGAAVDRSCLTRRAAFLFANKVEFEKFASTLAP